MILSHYHNHDIDLLLSGLVKNLPELELSPILYSLYIVVLCKLIDMYSVYLYSVFISLCHYVYDKYMHI